MRIELFMRKIALYGNKPALIAQNRVYSYKEIFNKVSAINIENIKQGSVVALGGDYSFDFIATFFALCNKGCIVAPILPRNIDFDLSEFGIEFIIATKEIKPLKSKSHDLLNKLKIQNQSGLIIFSSGSTGKPKAIVHNLETLISNYLNKAENPLKIISAYLPDHIAGIDVLLSTLGGGGTLIVPKSRTPKDILESIQTHKAEILPASPTLLRLLLLADIDTYNLKSLKLIVYGSERMSDTLLRTLQEKLPFVRFKQSFGTSETNAIKTKELDSKKGFIKILSDYKIINNELFIRSKTQALGYLNSDNSVFDDGYFATGDIVETIDINGEEYLRIIGRAKEVINVGGEKVLPQEVEGVLLEIPQISDCLVYGESNAITGQSVSVKVVVDCNEIDSNNSESISPLELKKLIRSFCKDKLAPFKIPTKVVIVESLEVSERFKKVRK